MGLWSAWWSLELWWLVAGHLTRLQPSRFTRCLTRKYGSGHKRWHWCAFALSWWLFFFFLFRLLVVIRLWVWVCDFGGLFFFFFFFFRLLVVMRLWFWRVVFLFLFLFLVVGGEWWLGCGFGFVIWLWFWWLVVMVVGGDDSGNCCSCGGVDGWFYFFFCFRWWWPAAASCGCGFAKKGVSFQRKGETERKKQRIKKTIFKWSAKKIRIFDGWCIIKWNVKS